MRTWTQRSYGEPLAVMELAETAEPAAGAGEVVLEPEMIGLSAPDLLIMRGEYQGSPPPPITIGAEVVGRVVDAGAGSGFATGARVLASASAPAGALSERVVVSAGRVDRLPEDVAADTAACLLVNYVTGHLALHERAALREGETVLVLGAPGGVGSATVDLAVVAGARVIASVRTAEEADACAALGATVTFQTHGDGLVEEVRSLTDGRGADVVVDPVGGDGFDAARKALAFAGRIVVVGFMGGRIATVKTNALVMRNIAVMGVNNSQYMAKRPDIHAATRAALIELAAQGRLRPVIADRWPFDEAVHALDRLARGGLVGKALVYGPGHGTGA